MNVYQSEEEIEHSETVLHEQPREAMCIHRLMYKDIINDLKRLNAILQKLPAHDIILLLRRSIIMANASCLHLDRLYMTISTRDLMLDIVNHTYFTLSHLVVARSCDLIVSSRMWNSKLLEPLRCCFTDMKLTFIKFRRYLVYSSPLFFEGTKIADFLAKIDNVMRLISLICGQIFANDELKVFGKMRSSDDGNYFPKWGNENREISLCNWNISSLIRRFDGISGHMEVWDSRTGNMCVACGWDLTTVENFNIIDCCSHLMCFDCSQQLYHPFLYGR